MIALFRGRAASQSEGRVVKARHDESGGLGEPDGYFHPNH
jgi:hypothetical protein